jgi:two-component system sensor histidine kinase KdpD
MTKAAKTSPKHAYGIQERDTSATSVNGGWSHAHGRRFESANVPGVDAIDTRAKTAAALLSDIGEGPRLRVYLGIAPGAGKTRRMVEDALALKKIGRRVYIGALETKGRPDLTELAASLPVIPSREVTIAGSTFEDFDFDAALAAKPDIVVLDELAHANLPGSRHAKRWQDAAALIKHGIGVLGAVNVQHIESVAPTAERIIGFPVREIVPMSFIKNVDQLVAVDVSPDQLQARLREGKIVRTEDIDRALAGPFRLSALSAMRELMLRLVDDFTTPEISPTRVSTVVALLTDGVDANAYLKRVASIGSMFDLLVEVACEPDMNRDICEAATAKCGGKSVAWPASGGSTPHVESLSGALIAIPHGDLARALLSRGVDRDILVASDRPMAVTAIAPTDHVQPVDNKLRNAYGRLTIYLGSAAGSGKTYAMLDRGHQLKDAGIDVVVGFVETHGRAETARKLEGLEVTPRKKSESGGIKYEEMDRDAIIARHPQVALVDELAHTNAPGSVSTKRYMDVFALQAAGISVLTTLNIQHLEGLGDSVTRLTGVTVRETLPDWILEMADDLILIDVSPEILRERLRAGFIYPSNRIEASLSNFFRTENLAALRELALRETLRTRTLEPKPSPVDALVLGVGPRQRDVKLILRGAKLRARLDAEYTVVHIQEKGRVTPPAVLAELKAAAEAVQARWIYASAADAAKAIVPLARERSALLAVEGARATPRWPRGPTFARRALEAGARELLVLAPPPSAS